MNADAFRHFFEYHFTENRHIWNDYVVQLSQQQFTQDVHYAHGSVRDQVAHLVRVDEAWFSGLCGGEIQDSPAEADLDDREKIRAWWDTIEQAMRVYLADLTNEMLVRKPFPEGEDENLILWQVLLHVVNHGTDHRAQLLRVLNDLGVKTTSQDYIFFVYDHP